jgi:hypothetical protein|tara:strand:+ start:3582 stop:3788 length:207 start_codon:yes stop_codon:yes gene_type:complete
MLTDSHNLEQYIVSEFGADQLPRYWHNIKKLINTNALDVRKGQVIVSFSAEGMITDIEVKKNLFTKKT